MRLKTFTAKTMSEAMKLVRQTLGDEAVIIATKEENGGQSVQVTAAIEQTDTLPDPYPEGYETSSARPNFELDTSTTPKFSNDQT
jgi:flagellar biosynthesis protein FlhF